MKSTMNKAEQMALNIACRLLMYGTNKRKGRIPYDYHELKLMVKALRSQNLFSIDGTMIPAFEKEFAAIYKVPYAVASTSGTAAIHTALGALDLNPGDEVITAPITDIGTIVPILYQNAVPVFADVDETLNMDPIDVERKITPRTRAIIVVHLFGNPCNMTAMMNIRKKYNIPIIEDCAQAALAEFDGKYVGSIGDIGCFSFMQTKHLTTGEGGMTITSNLTYYERMKFFVDKGWARKGWGPRAYLFLAPNYRPTELVGAVGLAQLRKNRGIVEKRRALCEYLNNLLSHIEGISPVPVTSNARHSYWLFPMTIQEDLDVNSFAKEMLKEKIWVSAGYIGRPIYLCSESLWAKKTYGQSQCPYTCRSTDVEYQYKEGLCPRAEKGLKQLVCLTIDESWTSEDVKRTVDIMESCVNRLRTKNVAKSSIAVSKQTPVAASSNPTIAPVKKTRVGVVGCGQMGRWHLDAYKLNPNVEVVAFADTDFEKAEEFAKEVAGQGYASHREMIANVKLDGVSICTVPSTHKDIALDLLEAGINVLCEKPLALSVAQAKEMTDLAKQKNLLLLTAFKFRFFDEVLEAKALLEKGVLGRIFNFRLMFGGNVDAAGLWYSRKEISGGGVVIDNASHAVDLVRYLFGEIQTISAQMKNFQNIDVEDTAKLTLSMKEGFFGTIDLSWDISIPSKAYLEIYGEGGTILLNPSGITYKLKTWTEWKTIPNVDSGITAFARQTKHFVDSIADKSPTILNNEDGLMSQFLIEAAYESAKQDKK
jgi:perosamine synthetase